MFQSKAIYCLDQAPNNDKKLLLRLVQREDCCAGRQPGFGAAVAVSGPSSGLAVPNSVMGKLKRLMLGLERQREESGQQESVHKLLSQLKVHARIAIVSAKKSGTEL